MEFISVWDYGIVGFLIFLLFKDVIRPLVNRATKSDKKHTEKFRLEEMALMSRTMATTASQISDLHRWHMEDMKTIAAAMSGIKENTDALSRTLENLTESQHRAETRLAEIAVTVEELERK